MRLEDMGNTISVPEELGSCSFLIIDLGISTAAAVQFTAPVLVLAKSDFRNTISRSSDNSRLLLPLP